ncbi:MAG: hypothetical protein RR052_01105 [Oscillospiraceae bacterium]
MECKYKRLFALVVGDNASKKHIPFGMAGIVAGIFAPCTVCKQSHSCNQILKT